MRTDDLGGGSLKALLLLFLVAANLVAALPHDHARLRAATSAQKPLDIHQRPENPAR